MGEAIVRPDGRLILEGRTYRAVLGRGGVRADKQEGDGATPSGGLPVRRVLYRADRLPPPRCDLPVEPLAPEDGWCDDPTSPDYNRMIRVPHADRHERLWRADHVYDVIGVLGWNDRPVVRGRGSAIFLHVARPDLAPTQGCVAMALQDLLLVLAAGLTALRVEA